MPHKIIFLTGVFLLVCSGLIFAELGDANGDNTVDIIDALTVARKYVGLDTQPFLKINSDVNGDRRVNILDALQIAQRYVGSLSEFANTDVQLPVFETEKEFVTAFENTRVRYADYWMGPVPFSAWWDGSWGGGDPLINGPPVPSAGQEGGSGSGDYSTTNVQVEGVDEADIIKCDGNFIYMLAGNELIIADAYPPGEARIYSRTSLKEIIPREMFINGDTLLVFGYSRYSFTDVPPREPIPDVYSSAPASSYYYPSSTDFVSIKLYDISDKAAPVLIKRIEIEGSYLSSRKIGNYAYFIINSRPNYYIDRPTWQEIVPMYREATTDNEPVLEEMHPLASYNEIGYIEPIQAQQFLTVAALNMQDREAELKRRTIIGSGKEIYASLENLYVAQQSWLLYTPGTEDILSHYTEKTYITKFSIAGGEIEFAACGSVKGHILNQFSMDEYDNHFRIATTHGNVWNRAEPSTNNVYVLDAELKDTGALEGLAPGESIYSVRFTGSKGYLVTFVNTDPLFVIDLSDHTDPRVLGELKIPGYSDYLHPYDENHIIGIGKNAAGGTEFFSWYQGIKIALFDVSDVTNPVEMYTESIGHRGTQSEALHNHKAFLFDREKELLCIPITLAEIKGEPVSDSQYGEITFQGAYVYNLNLEEGFHLKGRLTHHDDITTVDAKKSFDRTSAIQRSLYIDNILYTFSQSRLQGNDLGTLQRLLTLDF